MDDTVLYSGNEMISSINLVKRRCQSASSKLAFRFASAENYAPAGFSRPPADASYKTLSEALFKGNDNAEKELIPTCADPPIHFPLVKAEELGWQGWGEVKSHCKSHLRASTARTTRSTAASLNAQTTSTALYKSPVSNGSQHKSAVAVDAKSLYVLTEEYLENHNMLPKDLIKPLQDLKVREKLILAENKDKARVAKSAAWFRSVAWRDTFEDLDICNDDIDEEFLTLMLGCVPPDKTPAVVKAVRIQEEKQNMHGSFMRKARSCISASSQRSGVSSRGSNENRPVGGGQTVASLAKTKPRISSATTDRDVANAVTARPRTAGAAVPATTLKTETSDNTKTRPRTASSVPRPMTASQTAIVRRFFSKQVSADHDSEHAEQYRMFTMPPLPSQNAMPVFSMNDFIVAHREVTGLNRERNASIKIAASSTDSIDRQKPKHVFKKEADADRSELFMNAVRKMSFERSKGEIEAIFSVARQVAAFEKLGDNRLRQLCKVITYSRLDKDSLVFKQGDPGTIWFVIIAGLVSVSISKTGNLADSVLVRQVGGGEGFGQIALMTDQPRTATIITAAPTEMFKIEKSDYMKIIQAAQDAESKETLVFFKLLPIFLTWNHAALCNLSYNANCKVILESKVIYEAGKPDRFLYFVKKGTVSAIKHAVTSKGAHIPIVVGILKRGQYFGEEAVLSEFEKAPMQCTMVAGDLTHWDQHQIKRFLGGKSVRNPTLLKEVVELVRVSIFDARMTCRNLLKLSPWTFAPNEQLLDWHQVKVERKRWLLHRRKEMDSLLRERRVDPNASLAKVRSLMAKSAAIRWR
ncbi:Rap guanine nucleotide exchange factor 4 [Chytriomyces hyalinus]|nr:Rap guanine nucleotide exchange factor 4 [Chytriomyces hyalinus]